MGVPYGRPIGVLRMRDVSDWIKTAVLALRATSPSVPRMDEFLRDGEDFADQITRMGESFSLKARSIPEADGAAPGGDDPFDGLQAADKEDGR